MKNLLLILIIAGCCVPVTAQNRFGIVSGINLSSTAAEDASRIGIHAGFLIRIPIPLKFYGQAEIQYTQKGFKRGGQFIESFDFLYTEQRFDYLSTVFSLGYNVHGNLSVQLGAEGAYLINARTVLYEQVFSGAAGMDKFDFSLTMGLQFQINQLSMYARYVHGFVDMRDFYLTDINGLSIGKGEVGTLQTFQVGVALTNILSMKSSLSKGKVSSSRLVPKGRNGNRGKGRK